MTEPPKTTQDLAPALLDGPRYLLTGYRLLLRPQLRRYVLLPTLGSMALIALLIMVVGFATDAVADRFIPPGWQWLNWILLPLVVIATSVLGWFGFALVMNLLMAPFLGQLAAAVEQMQGGTAVEHCSPSAGFAKDLRDDLGNELRRLSYILPRMLAVLVLGFIPGLQAIALPLGLLMGAWMIALEQAGHALGNRRMPWPEQLRLLRSARAAAVGFGLLVLGMALVPVLNFVLIPAAVIGMTLMLRERVLPAATVAGKL